MRSSILMTRCYSRRPMVVAGAACAGSALIMMVASSATKPDKQNQDVNVAVVPRANPLHYAIYKRSRRKTLCEADYLSPLGGDVSESDGYSEAERFEQCLAYHRTLYFDYHRRWGNNAPEAVPVDSWPRRVPTEDQIRSIEADFTFCQRGRGAESKTCQDMEFRIACYYIHSEVLEERRRAWKMLKSLAEAGHADGMCYYGMILQDGLDGVMDASSELSVVWIKRCMEYHPLHIASNFEFAKAVYLGDGIPENLEVAVELFLKMAHLGHAGAAYMLGECLLEGGVGVKRDRADALEWFVTAAELGHFVAQKRVLAVVKLEPQKPDNDQATLAMESSERAKWADRPRRPAAPTTTGVTIERRHTLGPSPPAVIARRMTKLAESRGVSPPSAD